MPFILKEAVPWGRNFNEYQHMFALSEADLQGKILGCSDGPASFNAEATANGVSVISVDPIYAFSAEHIRQRIDETYNLVIEQTRANQEQFLWTTFSSIDDLGQKRLESMNRFLVDFPTGFKQGRYLTGELPHLPFKEQQFDLALVSHFLFLYSHQFSAQFHIDSILQLARVAKQVRIFPLHDLENRRSVHLGAIVEALEKAHFMAKFQTVDYEFQRGASQMLVVSRL